MFSPRVARSSLDGRATRDSFPYHTGSSFAHHFSGNLRPRDTQWRLRLVEKKITADSTSMPGSRMMLHDDMADPIAPKQPHSTSVPRESRMTLVIKKEMLSNATPRADRRVNTRQQAEPAGEFNEGEGPPEAYRQRSRQYIEIVYHSDRVVFDIHQLPER